MNASGNVKAGRAFVEIMLDQTKLERGLKAAQAKIKNFGTSLTTAGKGMVTVATIAAAPFAFATKTFADFDDQMRMVKAVTGATEAEFKSMTEVAEKLGRETSFTAKQVAEGMTAMGRMGFNAKEIEAAIPAVLNLSRATGTELGEAAEIAANNMRVFGIESSKMAGVADILTATANGSAQTLTDLAEGLKMAGPQAAAAKDNIVNVSAALGVLANMGIKGSLAGTALRKAYSQFAKTDIQDKLKEIGIATVDANGNLRSMPDIMADIAKAMAKMPTAKRLAFAEEIFDLRGSLAGLQLGGNIQQLDEFIKKLKNVSGAAAQTASEMDKGIGGAFRRFLSAVEGVQLAIGRIIGNALAPYIDKVSEMLNKMAEWIAKHKEVVIMLVKVIAGVAALGAALVIAGVAFKVIAVVVGGLCTVFSILKVVVLAPIAAVKGLIAVFTLLKTVLIGVKVVALATWAAISSPAVLVGAALGVLVAAIWKLTGAWDICADAVRGLAGDFGTAFAAIGDVVGQTWEVIKLALASGDLAGAAKVGLAALKVVWLTGLFPLKKAWFELKNFLADSWTVTIYSILKLGNNLWYGLLMGLKQVGDAIADAWSFLWDGVIGAFESTVGYLKKKWIEFKGFFDSDVNVDAEIARVDAEMAEGKQQREQRSADAVNRRAGEREALGQEWDSSNQAIDEAMNQEINENRQNYNDALSGAAAEIEAAKGQWQSAMDEVRKRAAEKAEKTEEVRKKTEEAAAGTSEAESKVVGDKATGSWSAEALDSMLGSSSAQERTATATEESARQQKETNKHLKKIENSSGSITYGD
ncbi:MAG: Phage-related minor tail protein [Lentisphaerae bacterium ADurb.Bin242]|nr:MAG: Phage-related minor tail protein [Lentisphaerae bacterium ADurb.Bin242]